MELDLYKEHLKQWRYASKLSCPDERYQRTVVDWWCHNIASVRAEEYGTEFWERFGPQGVFAQMMNCWYRWRNDPDDVSSDTLIDTFGYTVLYAMSMGLNAHDIDWETAWNYPELNAVEEITRGQELLIKECWFGRNHATTYARMAFAIAYSEWRLVYA